MPATIYFAANALIYAAFALWCTCSPGRTSLAAGYLVLDSSGRGEYMVVYGGLQLGLALFFAWLACDATPQPIGLRFALLLYVPIVLFRAVALVRNRPQHAVTWAIAAMELGLLVWGAVVFLSAWPGA